MLASDLRTFLAECCAEVLDSMYFTTVLAIKHQLDGWPVVTPDALAFYLQFEGHIRGNFGISLDASMARTLASNFLGEEEEALTQLEVAEVVGELTNMLCGSVVSRIEGKFALTHPEPYLASNQRVPGQDESILVSLLETDMGSLKIWVAVDSSRSTSEQGVSEVLQAAR